MVTTRGSRALAWIGTIPHWLYFTALRINQPLWYRIVVWTSALACVLAVLGLVLGITQWRDEAVPAGRGRSLRGLDAVALHHRRRVRRVHADVGVQRPAVDGAVRVDQRDRPGESSATCSRAAPWICRASARWSAAAWDRVARRPRDQGSRVHAHPGRALLRRSPRARRRSDGAAARAAAPAIRRHRTQPRPDRLLVAADTLEIRHEPFSVDSLVARLKAALPDVPIVEHELLSEYDSYYYSRGRQTPLPVLRVRFDDPAETWVYIDPEMSQVLAQIHRLNRVERWLYNGLHSLDFSFWYDRRPLWDIGMIALLPRRPGVERDRPAARHQPDAPRGARDVLATASITGTPPCFRFHVAESGGV